MSSIAQEKGELLAPTQVRQILMDTGTPQDKSTDTGHIGPLPNLSAASCWATGQSRSHRVPRSIEPQPGTQLVNVSIISSNADFTARAVTCGSVLRRLTWITSASSTARTFRFARKRAA